MDYEALKRIIPKQTRFWSKKDVSKWLQFIKLESLIFVFEKLVIDGSCLKLLNQIDLVQQMGIKSKIICKKLLNWIMIGFDEFDNTFLVQYNSSAINSVQTFFDSTQQINFSEEDNKNLAEIKKSQKKNDYCHVLIIRRVQEKTNAFHKFRERDCRIGRDPNCQIQITGQKIDPFHTHISYRSSHYYIRNIAVRESTYTRVDSRIQIQDEMQVEMGSNIFKFKILQDLRLEVRVAEGLNVDELYRFPTLKNRIMVGRKNSNDLSFSNDHTLSNLHGRITYNDLNWYLQDLVTTNGTWIKVTRQQKIKNGLVFKLGQTNFQFQCELLKVKQQEDQEQSIIESKKQITLCMICHQKLREILFVPCNHVSVCQDCSSSLKVCLICNQKITKTTKIFRT